MLRLGCLAAAVAISQAVFIQYCDLLFDCGCQPLWAGRAEHCNIHNPDPPHCPWCMDAGALGQWTNASIVLAQAGLALWPGAFGAIRSVSVFLAFPVVGGLGGLLAGLAVGYWQ